MDQEPLFTFLAVFSFILGTMIGSFLNVCVYRIPAGLSIVKPRSRCPKCETTIAWYDNIPIVSWLILGAKCRRCGQPISWMYPMVEAITGLLFLLVFWRFGISFATVVYMVFVAGLVLATFTDLTTWIIPDEVTLPGIPIAVALAAVTTFYPETGLRVMGPYSPIVDALIGVELGGGILFLLDKAARLLLKKPGMGMGDVKLLALVGGMFGWVGALLTLMISAVVGSVIHLALLPFMRNAAENDKAQEDAEPVTFGDLYGMPGTILIRSIVEAIELFASKRKTVEITPEEAEEDEDFTLLGRYLPFGPYICLAAIIVMFYGPEIIQAYLTFIGYEQF